MKVLVCGGRDYADRDKVFGVLDGCLAAGEVSVVIHGGARGADSLAHEWAISRGIPPAVFPALWSEHGKAAGMIRNRQMLAERPSLVIAFPGGRGTANMVGIAKKAGVPVREY